MASGTEAIADLATGTLIARAVDGGGNGDGTRAAHAQCLNCGTALVGSHCHECGQAAHVHRSLGGIWHDLAHGALHFEGKIWRTLPLLIMRPGELTRRYVDGERQRFLSPLAMFLFTVFTMFAVLSLAGIGTTATPIPRETHAEATDRVDAELAKISSALDEARAAGRTAEYNVLIGVQRQMEGTRAAMRRSPDGQPAMFYGVHTGWSRLDAGIAKAQANPSLLIYKLQSSAYKFSWVLVPLSIPFMALLFLWRRRFGMYDHAVFVTYSLAFMSLLVIVLSIAGSLNVAGSSIALMIALLVPPVHMYKQLRGAYALSRFSAGWRLVFLVNFASWVLISFVLLLTGWGLLG